MANFIAGAVMFSGITAIFVYQLGFFMGRKSMRDELKKRGEI